MKRIFEMIREDNQLAQESLVSDYWFDIKSLFTDKSANELDVSKLDHKKIKELERYQVEIAALDEWVLIPDYKKIPALKEFGDLIKKLYGLNKPLTTYRGMRLKKTGMYGTEFQNDMGLSESKIGRRLIPGEELVVEVKTPLSWTEEEFVAVAFGDTVVKTMIPASQPYLYLSDELCYLICKLRNLTPVSQREIITFPPFKARLTVVSVRG